MVSTGRRNTSRWRWFVAVYMHQRVMAIKEMRGKIWSRGRASTARREHRVRFWEAIARGLSSSVSALSSVNANLGPYSRLAVVTTETSAIQREKKGMACPPGASYAGRVRCVHLVCAAVADCGLRALGRRAQSVTYSSATPAMIAPELSLLLRHWKLRAGGCGGIVRFLLARLTMS